MNNYCNRLSSKRGAQKPLDGIVHQVYRQGHIPQERAECLHLHVNSCFTCLGRVLCTVFTALDCIHNTLFLPGVFLEQRRGSSIVALQQIRFHIQAPQGPVGFICGVYLPRVCMSSPLAQSKYMLYSIGEQLLKLRSLCTSLFVSICQLQRAGDMVCTIPFTRRQLGSSPNSLRKSFCLGTYTLVAIQVSGSNWTWLRSLEDVLFLLQKTSSFLKQLESELEDIAIVDHQQANDLGGQLSVVSLVGLVSLVGASPLSP